jgi:23S rRNA (cytidine1920-2'-O)/16S rRNA (cytidine1409-2'-O)-methyltransferase
VLERVTGRAAELGWSVGGLERSPIRGPAGNVEFLLHLFRGGAGEEIDIRAAIDRVLPNGGEPG